MKIIHYFDKKHNLQKEVNDEPGFILTNKKGGYLWLGQEPNSRYQGWFFTPLNLAGKKLFKVIENIKIIDGKKITSLQNNFWNIERQKEKLKEKFFLPLGFNSLVYEINQRKNIEIVLDVKESYDNREHGRMYDVFKERNCYIVKYNQIGLGLPSIFLAIMADTNEMEEKNQWLLRRYPGDEQRNSPPFSRYVFKPLNLKAKKVVFAVAEEKDKAVADAQYVFKKIRKLKKIARKGTELLKVKKIKNKEVALAYLNAQNSLNNLAIAEEKNFIGLYAGLPWFFQFWLRDTAISLTTLMSLNKKTANNILWQVLKRIETENSDNYPDSIGWFFKRTGNLIGAKKLTVHEIKGIKFFLIKTIERLLKEQTKDDFALNRAKETWMDSLSRQGVRIEMQALRLAMYRLGSELAESPKEKEFYCQLEQNLKAKVRNKFWDGNILADGFEIETGQLDLTLRPNIFLAAYIYPDLLTKEDWTKCFDQILAKLWLDWGGISTIDKTSPSFHSFYTGETPDSYHQGDSWFFLNNLAALVLFRADKIRFEGYIAKILKASTKEILWQGVIGSHAELSSANDLKSQGCLNQAWSNALYIELIDEIEKTRDLNFLKI